LRGRGRVRGAVRPVSLRGVLLSCGHRVTPFPGVSRPRLFRVIAGGFPAVGTTITPGGAAGKRCACLSRLPGRLKPVTWQNARQVNSRWTFGFRSNRAQWPRIPHAQLAVARLRSGVRRRRGAALARAGPRPRPRPPWPASPGPARHASPGTRRYAHLAGRAPRRTNAFAHACKRAARHINNRYQLHMITPRPSPDNCFTGMDLNQSGSPPEGPDRPLPGDYRVSGHSSLSRYPEWNTD
jgi:hypothetical protein